MFKNLTIRQITLLITGIVGFVGLLILFVLFFNGFLNLHIGVLFMIVFGQFIISYLAVKNLLERFIFRKIKLIYKFIFESKLGPLSSKKTVDFNQTSLEDVNQEVVRWKENKEKEIESLKTLEDYRKNYVGNISHELKTPIFSIQGYLHTLLDGGIFDENVNTKYLDRAISNVERLQNIVEDLEIISKYENGNLNLDFQVFDIKELVQEIIDDLSVFAKEHNISIQFKANADNSFLVVADREAMRQVLNNLIVNSIKYGKDKGITKLSIYDVEQNVLVEVSDNGIGIEEMHLKHLFDRFYRVDASRSRSQGGSGLGLSIVKHIIEAHKQTITVRSTSGVGSTFGFTLKKAT